MSGFSFIDSDLPVSYQAFLVADDFPAGLAWPGVGDQILALLDDFYYQGAGVDYTLHTRVRNRAEALASNGRGLRQLSEQGIRGQA